MIQDIGIGHSTFGLKRYHNVYFIRRAIEFMFRELVKGMA